MCGKKKGGVLGVYKGGCETGEAIKSLAFTLAALPTKKNVARLGAAEVPADRETSVVSLRFVFLFFFFRASERSCSLDVSFIATTCRTDVSFCFFKYLFIYWFVCSFQFEGGKKKRIASVQL